MTFNEQLNVLIGNMKAAWADKKITLVEFVQVITQLMTTASFLANELLNNPGEDKKQIVLHWVGAAFDVLWPSLTMSVWLAPFKVLLYSPVRSIVLSVADGAIEIIYIRFIKTAKPAA